MRLTRSYLGTSLYRVQWLSDEDLSGPSDAASQKLIYHCLCVSLHAWDPSIVLPGADSVVVEGKCVAARCWPRFVIPEFGSKLQHDESLTRFLVLELGSHDLFNILTTHFRNTYNNRVKMKSMKLGEYYEYIDIESWVCSKLVDFSGM